MRYGYCLLSKQEVRGKSRLLVSLPRGFYLLQRAGRFKYGVYLEIFKTLEPLLGVLIGVISIVITIVGMFLNNPKTKVSGEDS